MTMTTIHVFELKTIEGQAQKLSAYQGQVLLLANVASKCGLTPQYAGLESLYDPLSQPYIRFSGA
jgi:glutathione peroxidase